MKFIESLNDGENVSEIYFVKSKTSAVTKNGKPYDNLIFQDCPQEDKGAISLYVPMPAASAIPG